MSRFKWFLCLFIFVFIFSCKKSGAIGPDSVVKDTTAVPVKASPEVDLVTYKQGEFTVNFFNNDPGFDTMLRARLVSTFFFVYPQEVARFNPEALKTVTFSMDTAYHDIAGTANGVITFNPEYCHNNPNDLDMVTHEAMHIVQDYPGGGPGWITEGIADYARYKYGIHNASVGWMVQPYSLTADYTAGYGEAAHFFLWLEQHKNERIVDILDSVMRKSVYSDNIWSTMTGESLSQLWTDYGQDPVLLEEKTPIGDAQDLTYNSQITVSEENSSGFGSPESSFEVNDNNIKSKFLLYGFHPGLWLQLKLSGSFRVANGYALSSGNDSPERDPASWRLLASKDGVNWTELDRRSDQHFSKRNETYLFHFDNEVDYLYYKLVITSNAGSPDFQLSEWRMLYFK